MKKFVDYYRILGLGAQASGPEIRAAYVRLAKEHHPDKGGDSRKMNLINDAYDTLKNPLSRSQFDRRRATMREPVQTASQVRPAPAVDNQSKTGRRQKVWQVALASVLIAAGAWAFLGPGQPQNSAANTESDESQRQEELQNLKGQYDACVESFDQITSQLAQVNHEMNVAKSKDDTNGYNNLIPTQNQIVADYNAKRAECSSLKNQYNERVSSFNESALP